MNIKFTLNCIVILLLSLVITEASATGSFTLRDYSEAVRSNNLHKIEVLRSYILGAVDTHLLYSKMMRDYTGVNILCTGSAEINMNMLGEIFELRIMILRKRYGEDIMDMPITKAVQMIIEEEFKCY